MIESIALAFVIIYDCYSTDKCQFNQLDVVMNVNGNLATTPH